MYSNALYIELDVSYASQHTFSKVNRYNGSLFVVTVTELSGVQFGLKSYAGFQIQMNAQHEFDLKSQV